MSSPRKREQFATLVNIIAKLRAPDGCPWDRKQTHASLRENLLEECYEVLHALDEGDSGRLCDELGDLLLQIVLHTQIASEAGEFDIGDVINGINAKLIHRHPHVFGSEKVKDAEEVAHNWEALKQEERGTDTSILTSVPKHMPALGYSQEIQQLVARVGFDWEDIEGVIDKLKNEQKEWTDEEFEKTVEESGLTNKLKSYVQKEADRAVTKAIQTHDAKLKEKEDEARKQAEAEEAKKKAEEKMTEEEKRIAQLEETISGLNDKISQFLDKTSKDGLQAKFKAALKEAKIDEKWAEKIPIEKMEDIEVNVKELKDMVDAQEQAAIDKKLEELGVPKDGDGRTTTPTEEAVSAFAESQETGEVTGEFKGKDLGLSETEKSK